MNQGCFILEIVTPRLMATREIIALRLFDESGSFGIRKDHCDFLTTLIPAIGSYKDPAGHEHYLAADGGIFQVHDNWATLISGEIFEDDNAEQLAVSIRNDFLRRGSLEQRISNMIEGIENSFFEKLAAMNKEGVG